MTNRMRAGLFVLGGLLSTVALGAADLTPQPAGATTSHFAGTGVHSETVEPPAAAGYESEQIVVPGEEIAVADPSLAASAAVELTGEIVVTISEGSHLHDGADTAHQDEFQYSVETAGGAVVPIAGAIPETVSTGDIFTGSVAVDETVLSAVSPEAAVEVEGTSGSDAALPQDSSAAQEVINAAATTATELPVVDAQVTVTAAAAPGVARHELVIVVNSPPGVTAVTASNAQVQALGSTVAAHWQSSSNGLISAFTTNPTITRTSAGACKEDAYTTWNRAAAAIGFANWSDFRSKSPAGTARHLVVLIPEECEQSAGIGVGIVGGGLHYGGAVRQAIGGGLDVTTLAHEIGHNFGLRHANLHYCTGASCKPYEYWDIYDVMGAGFRGYDVLTPLNTTSASKLGFMPAGSTVSHSLAAGTPAQTFSLSITRLSATTGIRLIRLTDPISGAVFHIELRDALAQPQPYYALNRDEPRFDGRSVTFTPGVRMLLQTPDNGSAVIAASQPTGHHRTAIQAGQSLQSPSGGIKVTAVSGSPNSSMQLSVTLSAAGQSAGAATPSATGSIPIYRFWSDTYQGHFYTASAGEKAHIMASYPSHIWRYEAVAYQAFKTQVAGTVPLYRFWSSTMNGHFFTASEGEMRHVVAAYDDSVWKYEGIAYYVYPMSNTTAAANPVYRFWSATKRHHFYTASEAEKNHVIASYARDVWAYENAAFKVPRS